MLYNLLFDYKFLKDRNVSFVSLLPKPGPVTGTQLMVMKHFVDWVNALVKLFFRCSQTVLQIIYAIFRAELVSSSVSSKKASDEAGERYRSRCDSTTGSLLFFHLNDSTVSVSGVESLLVNTLCPLR